MRACGCVSSQVRGVVPLASFDSVETTQGPNDNLPYAFRLTARGGDVDSSFVFAAPSQRERDAWISGLAAAVAEENAAVEAAAASGGPLSAGEGRQDALSGQMGALAIG